ncbi:MAG: hypothetical protein AAGA61_09210 [Pseudomonadota bacterium]
MRLTGYLADLLRAELAGRVESITPANARGCQLSLVVRDARVSPKTVFDRITAQNVVADWREPNVIRTAPVPLYNSFTDAHDFVQRLRRALDD